MANQKENLGEKLTRIVLNNKAATELRREELDLKNSLFSEMEKVLKTHGNVDGDPFSMHQRSLLTPDYTPLVRLDAQGQPILLQIRKKVKPNPASEWRTGFLYPLDNGFMIITDDNRELFSVDSERNVTDWNYEAASKDKIEFVLNDLLPAINEELDNLKQGTDNGVVLKQVIKDLGLDKREPATIKHGRQPSNNKRPTIRRTKPLVPRTPTGRRY